MVFYVKLAGECISDEGEIETITLIAGFQDEDSYNDIEADGFDTIYHKFNQALDKDGSGYSLDGSIETVEILGNDDDDNDNSYDSDYDDSVEKRKFVADFMV